MQRHPIEGEEIEAVQGMDDGYEEENFNLVAKVLSDKELTFKTIKASLMGNTSVLEVSHRDMELWFQFHGVPFTCMNKRMADKVAKKLGPVMEVEDPWRRKLLQRVFLRVKDFYCFNCGRIEHARKECLFPRAMPVHDPTLPRYKPDLGVSRAKALSTTEEVNVPENSKQKNIESEQENGEGPEKEQLRRKAWIVGSGNLMENSSERRMESSSQLKGSGTEAKASKDQLYEEEIEVQMEDNRDEEGVRAMEMEEAILFNKIKTYMAMNKLSKEPEQGNDNPNSYSVEQKLRVTKGYKERGRAKEFEESISAVPKKFSQGSAQVLKSAMEEIGLNNKIETQLEQAIQKVPLRSEEDIKRKEDHHKGKEVAVWDQRQERPPKKKYRAKVCNQYFVEMPDEEDDGMECDTEKQNLEEYQMRGLELATILESTLSLKRKKMDMGFMIEEIIDDKSNVRKEREVGKKIKHVTFADMAGEAGLSMPHPEP
ncbi:hypothetical protein PIB30_039477 [Stylosanthes scabra]|uniref:CCHC-type domain-containing protein n=1 Tax=Stylosanthes scabra TaxID=79078 RepID=A0ABU6XC04_9FABA|nr:hypothetical protein [Stylosanthes scabra]